MDFRVEGVEEIRSLVRELDMVPAATRQKTKDATRKAGLATERGAKLRAAVDTAAMRSSVNTTLFGSGLGAGDSIGAEVGPEVDYAIHVELGTWKMAPQPFLGPSFDEVEPSYVAALDDIAQQALG